MGLDVLLIKPDFEDIAIMPPLGLGYLAATLKSIGLSVWIHDNTLLSYTDDQIANLIKEQKPKIVGIYAATPMIDRAMEISRLTRSVNQDALIVLGGPHPTYTVEETLLFADVVVMGEGEKTFPEIVTKFINGSRDFSNIKGCAFVNSNKELIINHPRDAIVDLDSLPFPSLDMMPVELYFKKGRAFGCIQRNSRSLPIMASRGCPSNCIFCQRFMGKKFRIRSAENIVDELSYWKNKFGVNEFNFLDDNFTLHKNRVIEVCDLIHKRNLNISFRFPNGVREDFLDEDILSALKSVGCYHLDFGIESGSQKVLDIMKKGKKVEGIANKVYLCHKKGFKLTATFLFGTPGETLDDMEETIRFATTLPLDSATFGIVIPFPGTELRKEAIEKGYLVKRKYEYYNPTRSDFLPLLETPEWSSSNLIQIIKKANRAFFLRPTQILRLFPVLLNPINRKRYISILIKILRFSNSNPK